MLAIPPEGRFPDSADMAVQRLTLGDSAGPTLRTPMNWAQVIADSLAFLLGALAASFAGVLTQLAIQRSHETSMRTALRAEIAENLLRIGPLEGTARDGFPGVVVRSAWESARTLTWPNEKLAVITAAYAAGGELNNRIALCDRNLSAGGVIPAEQVDHQRCLSEAATRAGKTAREAFLKAAAIFA
jgi:hypothetical protein